MSASFYDLLKYAATGIASPDMTAYDKMRALAMAGGSKVQTLTGIPPLTFKADGTPLISWSMLGNGSQSGTPSPQSIIMPTFCGVRTANLAPPVSAWSDGYVTTSGTISSANPTNLEKYSPLIPVSGIEKVVFSHTNGFPTVGGAWRAIAFYDTNGAFISRPGGSGSNAISVTTPEGATHCRVMCRTYGDYSNYMLNAGTEPLPYEPYGWKIPITCAGQTVPVYLGQTQTVRRIKKLVLTGDERWETVWGVVYTQLKTPAVTTPKTITVVCDRYAGKSNLQVAQGYPAGYGNNSITFRDYNSSLMIRDDTYGTDTTAWKSYLAAQYAAGTPVTVWYVLATPTTGIVNEPLAKIGDYADELHSEDAGVSIPTAKGSNTLTVETDLQPSGVSITGRIKPE